jgi:hypothetical protein
MTMGEAKRRGTYEERAAEGRAKLLERDSQRRKFEVELLARRGKSRVSQVAIMSALLVATATPTKEPTP